MGVAGLRDAFNAAGNGQLTCQSCLLNYDSEGKRQLLTFAGTYSDGTPFKVTTDPFDGDPVLKAAETATKLRDERVASPTIITP